MSLVSMEEAQLCYTHFVLHCPSHAPMCWLRQAACGHHQWPGKVRRIPKACCRRLGKTDWGGDGRKEGKEKERKIKGEERLLKSEINKKLPVCLPCLPLFRQKSSLVFRLTWYNMDWAVTAYTGSPLETHALLLFPQTPSCFWRNINPNLFQNFWSRKVHCFGIGTVTVLEPTGSSQITSGKYPKHAFLTAFIFHMALSCFRAPIGGKLLVHFTVLE